MFFASRAALLLLLIQKWRTATANSLCCSFGHQAGRATQTVSSRRLENRALAGRRSDTASISWSTIWKSIQMTAESEESQVGSTPAGQKWKKNYCRAVSRQASRHPVQTSSLDPEQTVLSLLDTAFEVLELISYNEAVSLITKWNAERTEKNNIS